jgi:FkbM family methyltransferase
MMAFVAEIDRLHRFFSNHPLTRQAPLEAWLRFGRWQIASRLRREVAMPWIGGRRLIVRRGMTGASGNIYAGLHEFTDMMLPLHFLRPGDLFLDIGANIGSYTILAAGVCGATAWAFEPDPDAARHLRRNVTANDLGPLVTVHEIALGPERGTVAFTRGLDTMNKVATTATGAGSLVRQERLEAILGDARPIMAKLDVEGYEEQVLRGAGDLLAKPHLEVIELETVTPWIETELSNRGFERRFYDPFARALTVELNGLPFNNAVYVRDPTFVADRVRSAEPVSVLGRSV